MLTKDFVERERYEARVKAIRDETSLIQGAEQRGREQGLQQGYIARVHLCQRLLKRPVTSSEELSRLSLDELHRSVEELEAEVLRP